MTIQKKNDVYVASEGLFTVVNRDRLVAWLQCAALVYNTRGRP
jgi:hypothetical protein